MYDWDDLRVFLAALRQGSLSKAASDLGVSTSTASRRLSTLEDTLGVVLFSRTPDGLEPTDAARRIVEAAEAAERMALDVPVLARAEEAEPSGVVRVAVPGDVALLVLMPHIPALLERYPGIRLELEESVEQADLLRREVDMTIRVAPPTVSDELVGRRIRSVRWVVAANEAVAARLGVEPDLREIPWVHLPDGGPVGAWRHEHLRAVEPVMRVRNGVTLRHAVRSGVGVALLPWSFVVATPGLVELPCSVELPAPVPLWLVAHRAARRVAAVHAVWEVMTQRLSPAGEEQDLLRLRAGVRAAYGWF